MISTTHNILYVAEYRPNKITLRLPVRKVGITGKGNSTVDSRMGQLSNGTEAFAGVYAKQAYKFPDEFGSKKAESFLHNLFDKMKLRTNREWFDGLVDGESNIIEEQVKSYIDNLRFYGLNIIDLLEDMTPGQEETVISDDNEEIILKGADKTTWSPWSNDMANKLVEILKECSTNVTLKYTIYRLHIKIDGVSYFNLRDRSEPNTRLHIIEKNIEKLQKIKTLLTNKNIDYNITDDINLWISDIDMDFLKNNGDLIKEIYSIKK